MSVSHIICIDSLLYFRAQRVQNLAYALIQAGIKPGDRVAVIAPNSYVHSPPDCISHLATTHKHRPMIADAHQAVLAARSIITPINTRLTVPEVTYILQHSGAKLVLVDHEFTHLLNSSDRPQVPVIVCKDTGRKDDPYEDFLSAGRKFSEEKGWEGLEAEIDENVAACLCYTSGTTGRVGSTPLVSVELLE